MDDNQCSAATHSGLAVLETGRVLDEQTATPLLNQVRELTNSGVQFIVFDCSALEYITSFGLSVFLRARKLLRESNCESGRDIDLSSSRVRLVNVAGMVRDVLETAHLLKVLPVYAQLDDARQIS